MDTMGILIALLHMRAQAEDDAEESATVTKEYKERTQSAKANDSNGSRTIQRPRKYDSF